MIFLCMFLMLGIAIFAKLKLMWHNVIPDILTFAAYIKAEKQTVHLIFFCYHIIRFLKSWK